MRESPPKVITIPAKPEVASRQAVQRQLRVAAYCRVSTDDEEQLTSYEAQQNYYTDKIMTNREWTMAGIFADEGITGTSARKRPEFLKMIRLCKQKKIDIVLTKSISRFARNTVDCLNYIRALRELGIAVIFEKENINTLEADSEILITMLGAFAQAESESISANVRWGKRQAMREGKTIIQYNRLYAYEKGENGKPKIIQEQADVVRSIYDQYLSGASLRMIKDRLEAEQIPNVTGGSQWTITAIRSILTNEKYCGDVLLQKTYISDCISRKVIRNTGQLPMYLVQNHHEGIVERKTFDAVQAEMVRRSAGKSPSKKNAPTGMTSYASKYALSERLVCGECGTLYRRCTWSKQGRKRIVWRCVSRLDYGTKYCHNSPTLDEEPLQKAILAAINSVMSQKSTLIRQITSAILNWKTAIWSVHRMIKILFLCHGNICRSPMAEFIMKDLVKKAGLEPSIQIESAATSTEEIGNPVYPPARRKLSEHGIDCSGKRARQLLNSDYEKYDLLIGMDRANLRSMYRICGGDFADKMHLLMDFTDRPGEVADPWYTDDFDTTWRDVEEGCRGLLQKIISKEVRTSRQAGCQGSGN